MKLRLDILIPQLLVLLLILQVTIAAAGARASSNPFLSPLFGNNMVVQRGMPIPVWGWADPGAHISVSMNGATASGIADTNGKWMVKLHAMPAGGPYRMTVSGPEKVVLNNVLVGDVWICSGQSNMEMGIGNVTNAQQEIASADYPQIRLFTVAKSVQFQPLAHLGEPHADLANQWSVCTPQTIATGGWDGFSAVGYFFGRDLNQSLKVPIGLIHTSWGGTPAEAWTSAGALEAMPDYRTALEELRQVADRTDFDFEKEMAAWYEKNDPGSAGGAAWSAPDFDTSSWKTMVLPTNWEKAGLPDYDGVVWFRKEFTLPDTAAGKDIVLHLGPIDDEDTTWVNGVKVGAMNRWDLIRDYKVPASALKPGRNVIAIRVLDTGGAGGIYGKPEQMYVEIPGEQSISLAGPWLYQDTTNLAKSPPVPVDITNNQNFPTVLFNGMIAPLVPYAIKGVIWYQGESNAGKAYQYRTLLPTMIKDWRSHWGEGDFPFYIVQLANFEATQPQPVEDAWAELREAQLMTAESVPNTGLAVIIDIGDAKDIHPKDKQDVGKRLALIALAKTYGKKIEYSGPLYESMQKEGSAIRLKFGHIGGGLVAKGDKLEGFAIAGPDKHFVWADAKIEGNTIVVSSPQVSDPAAVRYAWAINPVCNLYNKAGLPASPFRTDDWPGITVNNK